MVSQIAHLFVSNIASSWGFVERFHKCRQLVHYFAHADCFGVSLGGETKAFFYNHRCQQLMVGIKQSQSLRLPKHFQRVCTPDYISHVIFKESNRCIIPIKIRFHSFCRNNVWKNEFGCHGFTVSYVGWFRTRYVQFSDSSQGNRIGLAMINTIYWYVAWLAQCLGSFSSVSQVIYLDQTYSISNFFEGFGCFEAQAQKRSLFCNKFMMYESDFCKTTSLVMPEKETHGPCRPLMESSMSVTLTNMTFPAIFHQLSSHITLKL